MSGLGEPSDDVSDPIELLLGYLDYFRGAALRKLEGMSDAELRHSYVASGWSPLELVQHLVYMERRWLYWGFAGEETPDVWGDQDVARSRWHVAGGVGIEELAELLRKNAVHTRAVVVGHELTERPGPGPRFTADVVPPALGWILFHVMQEYARHLGHLDVVRELADGVVGE